MQRNKVHHVHTVERVAKNLGVGEDLIHELTLGLEPEDGVIWVYRADDTDGTLAFTDEGVEEVQLFLEETIASPNQELDPSAAAHRGSIPCGLHRMGTMERVNREIKRRTEVVGIFPNEAALARLVGRHPARAVRRMGRPALPLNAAGKLRTAQR